ncbi:unnamed protein product [Closterium sp. Naga37s-1]|nr:unnamed protein product [Closterium sp. Naga37s-1]
MVVNSLPSDQSTDSVPGKRRPNLVTGLHGVKVLYGRFQSSIDFDGQRHTLGTWDDPMEAAKGYAAAAYMIVHLGVRAVSAILTEEEQACLKRMSHDDFITILKFPGAWKQWQRWEELMPRWRAHYENLARKHGEMDTVRIGRKKRKGKEQAIAPVGKFTAAAAMNGLQTPMFALDPGMHVEQGMVGEAVGVGVVGGVGVLGGVVGGEVAGVGGMGAVGEQGVLENGYAGGEGEEETALPARIHESRLTAADYEVLGYNQQAVTTLGVAKDVGDNMGLLAGLLADMVPPWLVSSHITCVLRRFTCVASSTTYICLFPPLHAFLPASRCLCPSLPRVTLSLLPHTTALNSTAPPHSTSLICTPPHSTAFYRTAPLSPPLQVRCLLCCATNGSIYFIKAGLVSSQLNFPFPLATYCTQTHSTALHCTQPSSTALHRTQLHSTTLQHTPLHSLSLQVWCLLCCATNGSIYFITAGLVSSQLNFPHSGGVVAGIVVGFIGLSGAIFAQVLLGGARGWVAEGMGSADGWGRGRWWGVEGAGGGVVQMVGGVPAVPGLARSTPRCSHPTHQHFCCWPALAPLLLASSASSLSASSPPVRPLPPPYVLFPPRTSSSPPVRPLPPPYVLFPPRTSSSLPVRPLPSPYVLFPPRTSSPPPPHTSSPPMTFKQHEQPMNRHFSPQFFLHSMTLALLVLATCHLSSQSAPCLPICPLASPYAPLPPHMPPCLPICPPASPYAPLPPHMPPCLPICPFLSLSPPAPRTAKVAAEETAGFSLILRLCMLLATFLPYALPFFSPFPCSPPVHSLSPPAPRTPKVAAEEGAGFSLIMRLCMLLAAFLLVVITSQAFTTFSPHTTTAITITMLLLLLAPASGPSDLSQPLLQSTPATSAAGAPGSASPGASVLPPIREGETLHAASALPQSSPPPSHPPAFSLSPHHSAFSPLSHRRTSPKTTSLEYTSPYNSPPPPSSSHTRSAAQNISSSPVAGGAGRGGGGLRGAGAISFVSPNRSGEAPKLGLSSSITAAAHASSFGTQSSVGSATLMQLLLGTSADSRTNRSGGTGSQPRSGVLDISSPPASRRAQGISSSGSLRSASGVKGRQAGEQETGEEGIEGKEEEEGEGGTQGRQVLRKRAGGGGTGGSSSSPDYGPTTNWMPPRGSQKSLSSLTEDGDVAGAASVGGREGEGGEDDWSYYRGGDDGDENEDGEEEEEEDEQEGEEEGDGAGDESTEQARAGGAAAAGGRVYLGQDHSFGQALSTVDFWLLYGGLVCGFGAGLTAITSLAQIGEAQGCGNAQVLTSLVSIWQFLGRLASGSLSEHFVRAHGMPRLMALAAIQPLMALAAIQMLMAVGHPAFASRGSLLPTFPLPSAHYRAHGMPRPMALAAIQLLMAVGHLAFALAPPGGVYLGSLLIGFTYGGLCSVMPVIAAELFGRRCLGLLYNSLLAAAPLGSYLFSGVLAGYLYEIEARKDRGVTAGLLGAASLLAPGGEWALEPAGGVGHVAGGSVAFKGQGMGGWFSDVVGSAGRSVGGSVGGEGPKACHGAHCFRLIFLILTAVCVLGAAVNVLVASRTARVYGLMRQSEGGGEETDEVDEKDDAR